LTVNGAKLPQMRKLKRIYIEITNVCNLKCSFCPDSGREPEFMDEMFFSDILNQVRDFSDYIYFHVKGEPLIHPQLERFLEISGEKKFRVSLATNGTLIAKTGGRLLNKPAVRQVSFSLHSLEGEKDQGYIQRYLDDIFSFAVEALKKTGMFIEFKLWNLDREKDNETNGIIFDHIENRLGVQRQVLEGIASGKGKKISHRLFLSRSKQFLWPDLGSPENNPNGFCYGLKRQAAILVDGTVVPCCLDGKGIMKLGNIKESSFTDIINSERALKIIRGFSERRAVEQLCRKCTYRDRFGF